MVLTNTRESSCQAHYSLMLHFLSSIVKSTYIANFVDYCDDPLKIMIFSVNQAPHSIGHLLRIKEQRLHKAMASAAFM